MSGFCVFGVTRQDCVKRARAKVSTRDPANKAALSPEEWAAKVEAEADKLFEIARPKQISPAFDSPQFCADWIALGLRGEPPPNSRAEGNGQGEEGRCEGQGAHPQGCAGYRLGSVLPAIGATADGRSMISSHYSSLSARAKFIWIQANRLYGHRRMHAFASVEVIVHKASLKLVSNVRAYELVNGIMDSDLLERHSDYRHDKPPRRLNGTEILPALSAKWAMTSLPERPVALVIRVRNSFTHCRVLPLAIPRVNGGSAGLKAISLIGLFECVDEATNLNFGWRDSNSDWHALPFAVLNRTEILA